VARTHKITSNRAGGSRPKCLICVVPGDLNDICQSFGDIDEDQAASRCKEADSMAEIGLIASVVGVACAGIKLSTTLYTFSETVATAADSIKAIAKDVSLTSAVFEEPSSNLKHDEQARLYSGAALKTAETVVGDCEAVFKQIDGALSKSMERISVMARSRNRQGKGGKVVLSAVERLK
jgi:hypothetical protein